MAKESDLEGQGRCCGRTPTGLRRLTRGLLAVSHAAESFAGLPEGVTTHNQLLAAFKAAAPQLGLSSRLVHALDWLFRFTRPQDWRGGGRPIVWPSAAIEREALGLSTTRVKALNRALIEAGLITMKDSPNGKRYGRRDPRGNIVEAYGFDLSPIAVRHAEFVRLAEEAREERELLSKLRRRATIARRGIIQILETARENSFQGEEWLRLSCEIRDFATVFRDLDRSDEMVFCVEGLERHQKAARARLEGLLTAVDSTPLGSENGRPQTTYKSTLDPDQDTVIAQERCSASPALVRQEPAENGKVLKLYPDELVRLAPQLKVYLCRPSPTWPDVVDAANWLRHDLDVSKSLWDEACLVMGRVPAAIALAVVSAKDPAHFRTTPGGYFHGMVAKAKASALNLDRTLWAMRRAAQPKPWSNSA
jgi:replication initiation protein RepC